MKRIWQVTFLLMFLGTSCFAVDVQKESKDLWGSVDPIPDAAKIPVVEGAEFFVIKPFEFEKDGYRFLHGVALAWHNGRLYASFGHNQGAENTDSEEARFCYSDDGGKTWSKVETIAEGEDGIGVSHGVFLSHEGRLWAFHGAYTGTLKDVHTRAYVLNEESGAWEPKGVLIEGGFWPLQEPLLMEDGNWIMAGASLGSGNPAAVAISHGNDLAKWDLVKIPRDGDLKMWGESTVILDGKDVVNIARYGEKAQALVAYSDDFGRTWTASTPSNLPMAPSKPYSGTLSTGQNYLICTTTADGGKRRSPLTIALTRPGELTFSNVLVIRPALFPEGPGESHKNASLAYPYAIEHDGKLYVGYSNSGGGVGRQGAGRQLWNNNSAEMAVIPLSALESPEVARIWDGGNVPTTEEIKTVDEVEIHAIRPADPSTDLPKGWIKGVYVGWHQGKLYAQFGFNARAATQGENSAGEEALYLVSDDDGKSWSEVRSIESPQDEKGVSHGVFLSHEGTLWSFNGAFHRRIGDSVHTLAFVLDESTGKWQPQGEVVGDGFWPMQEPVKMADGNWLMAGVRCGNGYPAAVAISHGNDLTKWDLVVIPSAPGVMWGESTVIVDGNRITNIARYSKESGLVALVAFSDDYGRTWTPSQPTNLPMANSKPIAGKLSTGQNYLICTTTADSGSRRSPLTIAISRPGESRFSKILSINHLPEGGSLQYPGAAEQNGKLFVGYTRGHVPEVAVIPIKSLELE